jgi:hypothetical protein
MRTIHEIASEILRKWDKVHYAAAPYLQAMTQLESVDQDYGFDSGRSVVAYFLSNARTWRGPDAKRIKAELKAHLGG